MMLRTALLLGSLTALAAGAAELREPRPLLASEQPAAGCGAGRAYGLVLRETPRPDVGPYAVTLAGYGQGGAASDRYAPYLLRMDPGGATRIALRNGLIDSSAGVAASEGEEAARARNAVNLHTHGLYTAARNAPPCDLGDFSLFALGGRLEGRPMPRADYRIALPATLPGAVVDSPAGRIPYPPGMAWFHAHVHGTSRDQVTAGMAGMITVGDPRAVLPPALRPVTDVRHLALRDIQLTVPDCPPTGRLEDGRACRPGPARLPGQGQGEAPDGAAIPALFGTGEGEDATLWDATLCGTFAGATPDVAPSGSRIGPGFCAPARTASGQPVWLFTVNGQWMPDITLRPGRAMLLRVANLSASVSFVLRLGEERLRVLAADGVVAGEAAPQGPGVLAESLLLMPGARAEILLENTGARRAPASLTLRSAGLAASREPVTTPEAEPAGESPAEAAVAGEVAGDVWPAVALARLILPAQEAGPALNWPAPPRLSAPERPTGPVPVAARTMPGCSLLPADTDEHRWHRRITFSKTGANETERFQMGMRVLNQHGQEFSALFPGASGPIGRGWEPEAWEPHGSASGQHAPPHNLICPVLGRAEVWVVANASPELHNLHLHQGRFRLARPADPGAPESLAATGPVTDPTGTLAGLFSPAAAGRLAWHDSLPVAPYSLPDAAGARVDGTTTIYLPFFAAEQEGLYPVHCHILEHEDKGMMAAIMVLPGMAPPVERNTAPAGTSSAPASDAAVLAALLAPDGRLPASCVAP